MRAELHRLRDEGVTFLVAWDIALTYALDQIPTQGERNDWHGAFNSMRPVWAEAYAGIPARSVPFVPDDEHVAA